MMQIPPESIVRTEEEAKQLAAQGVCLQCGKVDPQYGTKSPKHRRGLCEADKHEGYELRIFAGDLRLYA